MPHAMKDSGVRDALVIHYERVRGVTVALAAPLEIEDQVVQTMPDVSPVKWHLAHTSWFFETFVLRALEPGRAPLRAGFHDLFNSYYQGLGDPYPRPRRGTLSRPTVAEVLAYRQAVDEGMRRLFGTAAESPFDTVRFVIELGLNHEEQHQELILTDAKHVLAENPSRPSYRPESAGRDDSPRRAGSQAAAGWAEFEGGIVGLGTSDPEFRFDNERPRHDTLLQPFALARRLVTCGEFLAFVKDGGYERPELWMSDGWDCRLAAGWQAPLYWRPDGGGWKVFTLGGERAVREDEPVCHVSWYEADAFARWAGARLPLEAEWEQAAVSNAGARPGELLESGRLHPAPAPAGSGPGLAQLIGDAWEWTASPYVPYPGFQPFAGALGEYNGKFMANQLVLRGGSCVTPARHIRPSYRNFFPPQTRWQFSGIRLARATAAPA